MTFHFCSFHRPEIKRDIIMIHQTNSSQLTRGFDDTSMMCKSNFCQVRRSANFVSLLKNSIKQNKYEVEIYVCISLRKVYTFRLSTYAKTCMHYIRYSVILPKLNTDFYGTFVSERILFDTRALLRNPKKCISGCMISIAFHSTIKIQYEFNFSCLRVCPTYV